LNVGSRTQHSKENNNEFHGGVLLSAEAMQKIIRPRMTLDHSWNKPKPRAYLPRRFPPPWSVEEGVSIARDV
jgi:hypothetical protein